MRKTGPKLAKCHDWRPMIDSSNLLDADCDDVFQGGAGEWQGGAYRTGDSWDNETEKARLKALDAPILEQWRREHWRYHQPHGNVDWHIDEARRVAKLEAEEIQERERRLLSCG